MVSDVEPAAAPVPDSRRLDDLRSATHGCAACDLVSIGTQVVFAEGREDAASMLVHDLALAAARLHHEQPG